MITSFIHRERTENLLQTFSSFSFDLTIFTISVVSRSHKNDSRSSYGNIRALLM